MLSFAKDISRNLLAAIGAVFAIYNASIRAYPPSKSYLDSIYAVAVVGSVLLAAAISIYLHWPRNKVELGNLSQNKKLFLEFGNVSRLFNDEKDANFVIPVNDFFDTELGDAVSERSVHGQFVRWVLEDHTPRSLNTRLKKSLESYEGDAEQVEDKIKGKTLRYPQHSRACVELNKNFFFLVPTGKTDPSTLQASTDWKEYALIVDRVCSAVRERGSGRRTYIPLIGDQLARTGMTSNALVQQLATAIWRSDRSESIGNDVVIVLFDREKAKFDLRRFKKWGASVGLS